MSPEPYAYNKYGITVHRAEATEKISGKAGGEALFPE
jgi:hypothetical protein